ncbi:MAG: PucR family transcriptional regulator ligand-binding domain-containing protein [Acutalibacteraceae bacterium]
MNCCQFQRFQELTLDQSKTRCLDRPVATIESTETPDVISYVPKNCFIITTAMAYKENQEKLCELILSLDKLPCAGLGSSSAGLLTSSIPRSYRLRIPSAFPDQYSDPPDARRGVSPVFVASLERGKRQSGRRAQHAEAAL